MNIFKKMYLEFCSKKNPFGAKPYFLLFLLIFFFLISNSLALFVVVNLVREMASMLLHQKYSYILDHKDIIYTGFLMFVVLIDYALYALFIAMFLNSHFYKLVYRPSLKYPYKLACIKTNIELDVALPSPSNLQKNESSTGFFLPPLPGSQLEKCRKLATQYFLYFLLFYFIFSISYAFIPDRINFNITQLMVQKITDYKFCYAYLQHENSNNIKMVFASDYDKCLLPEPKFQSQTFYSADNLKDFKKDSSNIFWTILKFSIAPLLTFFLLFGKISSKKK